MEMEPRRYYVLAAAHGEHGPYNLEEMRQALEEGVIEGHFQVRTGLGTTLGTVESLLAASRQAAAGTRNQHGSGRARIPRDSGTHRDRRFSGFPLVVVIIALLLIGVVVIVQLPGQKTAVSAPPARAASPDLPSAPAGAAVEGARKGLLGMQSGTVLSILSDRDLMSALAFTHSGIANHKVYSSKGEIPQNVFDGNVETKYFNENRDGALTSGVNTGFAIETRRTQVVTAFQFATANDMEGRDPLEITIEGSDAKDAFDDRGQGFVLIYEGPTGLAQDPGRNQWGPCVRFANARGYRTYRVLVTKTRLIDTSGTQYSEFRLGCLAPAGQ